MNIFYSDEDNKLTNEFKTLMQEAADVALDYEYGRALVKYSCDIKTLPIDLSVSVVSDEEIQSINNEYRGINKVTDVLSFPQFADNEDLLEDIIDLAENLQEEDVIGTMVGDVVICYDKAVSQAEEYGTGIKRELIYLFVHSIFHLFGYDHMADEEKSVMRDREERVMEALGL